MKLQPISGARLDSLNVAGQSGFYLVMDVGVSLPGIQDFRKIWSRGKSGEVDLYRLKNCLRL
jgi:hypothetical protein